MQSQMQSQMRTRRRPSRKSECRRPAGVWGAQPTIKLKCFNLHKSYIAIAKKKEERKQTNKTHQFKNESLRKFSCTKRENGILL